MSAAIIMYIVTIIMPLLFYFLGSLSVKSEQKRIDKCTENVMGEISEILAWNEHHGERIRVKYTANGQEYEEIYTRDLRIREHFEKGQKIEVWYNPNKPDYFFIRELSRVEYLKKTTILAAVFALIVCVLLSIIFTAVGI